MSDCIITLKKTCVTCGLIFTFRKRQRNASAIPNSFVCKGCKAQIQQKRPSLIRDYKSEYKAWDNMRTRCDSSKDKHYHSYGGRGIQVFPEWKKSFQNFLRDMGPKPSADHTLERLDSNKNYEPSNCVWATNKRQQRNKRNTLYLEYRGVKRSLMDWCEFLDLSYDKARYRLKAGFTAEEVLSHHP